MRAVRPEASSDRLEKTHQRQRRIASAASFPVISTSPAATARMPERRIAFSRQRPNSPSMSRKLPFRNFTASLCQVLKSSLASGVQVKIDGFPRSRSTVRMQSFQAVKRAVSVSRRMPSSSGISSCSTLKASTRAESPRSSTSSEAYSSRNSEGCTSQSVEMHGVRFLKPRPARAGETDSTL